MPDRRLSGVLPRVLHDQQIRALIARGAIRSELPVSDSQVQPASLDLRLGSTAYEVTASILPDPSVRLQSCLRDIVVRELDLEQPVVLEKGRRYVVPLQESLDLPGDVAVRANPKSTAGRLDIVVRLIPQNGTEVDRARAGYRGPLFLEIAPRTFNVIVRRGACLTQIRFRSLPGGADRAGAGGRTEPDTARRPARPGPPVPRVDQLSVDLRGAGDPHVSGFRAIRNPEPIDFEAKEKYAVADYWEPIRTGESGTLLIEPDHFYVLVSTERVSISPDASAVLMPYNRVVGEFLFHYAGFFDPGFGYADGGESAGNPAALVVRSRWSTILLRHNQVLGRLVYESLVSDPDRLYGSRIGSSYQARPTPLGKQFGLAAEP